MGVGGRVGGWVNAWDELTLSCFGQVHHSLVTLFL